MSKDCEARCAAAKKTSIGGQALIEGVMMRGPKKTTMAVRHTSGEIVTESWDTPPVTGGVRKIPFLRGIFNFIDSMRIGYKSLMRSAELSGFEDEIKEEEKPAASEAETAETTADAPAEKKEESSALMTGLMIVSAVLGVGLALVLFMWLPTFLYSLLKGQWSVFDNRYLQAVCEGVLRMIIFLAYLSLTSLMKDLRRVYMYHGAEHKSIFCYENGLPLTVENVRAQSRFHPRCGTSFMILMLLIGVLVSMLIPSSIGTLLRTAIKILTVPVVMGIGYEAIKLAGRHDNLFTRVISAPGLWVQRITTKEPTDDMIECAITAFSDVVPENQEEDKW